jgi:hypothetical protein
MAQARTESARIELSRVPEGIKIHVKTAPWLEESFKSFSASNGGGESRFSTRHVVEGAARPTFINCWGGTSLFNSIGVVVDDPEIELAVAVVGSSQPEGKTFTLRTTRSLEQIRRAAKKVEDFVKEWFENHCKPFHVVVDMKFTMSGSMESAVS